LDLQELTGTPTLIISSEIQNQIQHLHKKVGKKEWSGQLIYEVIEGNTEDPDNLVMEAKGLFLMDIGEGSSTDFEVSEEDTFKLTDEYPELMDGNTRLGLIHTHHNMKVYFSGVDNDELKDNAEDYNAYLSLIVGFNLDYKARVAFITEKEIENVTRFSTKNMNDESFNFGTKDTKTEKVVCYYDCDVEMKLDIKDSFQQRYNDILKEKKKTNKQASNYKKQYPYNGYSRQQRKVGFRQNGSYNKDNQTDVFDSKYTMSDIRSFICKVASFNPNEKSTLVRNRLQHLDKKTNVHVYLNKENVLNIIDECIASVFSENEVNNMDNDDQADLLIEAIDYLERDMGNKGSLVEEFTTAKSVYDALEGILDDMLEHMETSNTKEKGKNEFSWF